MSGTLYVVATPIGNLADLSPRAVDTLREVDAIAAEDTRRTRQLLSHFGLETPTFALHDHNEAELSEAIAERIRSGENIALVSDAGTPLLSDPGYRLLAAAHGLKLSVVPIPGASATTAALSVSGLPTDRFCFEGFPPARPAARRAFLEALAAESRTLMFFESVHRLEESLRDFVASFGAERSAFLAREISKLHEQYVRSTLGELLAAVSDGNIPARGEVVLVVAGGPPQDEAAVETDRLLEVLLDELPGKQAVRLAARISGTPRNALYARMLELSRD